MIRTRFTFSAALLASAAALALTGPIAAEPHEHDHADVEADFGKAAAGQNIETLLEAESAGGGEEAVSTPDDELWRVGCGPGALVQDDRSGR